MTEVPTETGDRLYAVPPKRFVAERDAAAAEARAAGDRETAAALAALRRPTVAAWLVNLLALRRPDLIAGLADLAASLRSAQHELRGGQLRELATQRRALVSSLVSTAGSLAKEADPSLGTLPLAEVETTLQAALADPDVAEQVRAGRLLRPVEPGAAASGAHLRLVTAVPDLAPAESQPGEAQPGTAARDGAAREEAARELAAARTAAEAAEAERERAAEARRDAAQALAEIDAQLAVLQADRSAAASRLAQAEATDLDARRRAKEAHRRVARAELAAGAE